MIKRTESENTHSRQMLKIWNIEHKALMSLTMELHDIQYNPNIVKSLYSDEELLKGIQSLEILVDRKIAALKRKAENELKKLGKEVI